MVGIAAGPGYRSAANHFLLARLRVAEIFGDCLRINEFDCCRVVDARRVGFGNVGHARIDRFPIAATPRVDIEQRVPALDDGLGDGYGKRTLFRGREFDLTDMLDKASREALAYFHMKCN